MTSTFGRAAKKLGAGVLTAALGLSTAAALVPGVAHAATTVTTTRIAGVDRYDTAAKAAETAFPAGTNNLILASGEPTPDNNSPDALAASYLSGALGGAVLLTQKDNLPAVTSNAMGTLDAGAAGAATVYIVGGTAAISQTVRNQVKALGYTIVEISGTDRYDTASKVATTGAGVAGVGSFGGLKTGIIATGLAFPDALAGGGLAQGQLFPVLLTNAAVPSQTSSALTSLLIKQVIILGGTAAVPQSVEDSIKAMGIATIRVGGTNRNDTAAKLATMETNSALNGGFAWAGTSVILANGLNFPDALAAGQVSGVKKAPILLTASLPAETSTYLTAHNATITTIYGMGGTAAISDADIAAAKTAATQTGPTATITVKEAGTSATVAFSSAVTGATTSTNYALNNGTAGTGIGAITALGNNTYSVALSSPLHANDVFTVNPAGGTIADAVTTAKVATTSATVAADVTAPTATIKSFSNGGTVYVLFSEAVTTAAAANITTSDGKTSNALTAVANTGNTVYSATWPSGNPGAGATATLAANTFVDAAAAANKNVATSATVVTDTTAPTASTVKYTSAPAVQAIYHIRNVGPANPDISITALATGASAGAAGDGWTLVNGGVNSTVAVSVNTTTKQITIGAPNPAAVDPTAIATALLNNATFAANFTAAVVDASTTFNLTTAVMPRTTEGTSTITLTVTYSEGLSVVGVPTITSSTGTNPVVSAAATTIASKFFGVGTFTYTQNATDGSPVTATFPGGNFTDLSGANANLASTATVTT